MQGNKIHFYFHNRACAIENLAGALVENGLSLLQEQAADIDGAIAQAQVELAGAALTGRDHTHTQQSACSARLGAKQHL